MGTGRNVGTALVFTAAVAVAVEATALRDAPGPRGPSPATWPVGSRIPRAHDGPTVVVFLHPKCPCSRATVGELVVLLARCEAPARVFAIAVKPEGAPADWTDTALCRQLRSIEGVALRGDDGGREARLFGALTSGHTFVYDRDGTLRYSGGITGTRGEAGDNRGREAVEQLLAGTTPDRASCPVFGCSLVGDIVRTKEAAR